MHDINLLPWRSRQRKKQYQLRYLFFALCISVVACIVIFSKFYFKKSSIKNTMDFANIKYVGYLADQKRQWGLIIISDGAVQHVMVGNYLPQTSITIKKISAQDVQLETPDHQLQSIPMQMEKNS